MRKIYYIQLSYDGGKSFRVVRKWFFQNIVVDIGAVLIELEKAGKRNVFIERLERIE